MDLKLKKVNKKHHKKVTKTIFDLGHLTLNSFTKT